MTDNLKRRLHEHQSGYNRTTKSYRPFELIYTQKFLDRISAREHEKKLKSGSGREFLKKIRDKK